MAGTLYLVATPIGNLEDITLRALRVLREVDLLACEDTRHTRKLLARYDISKPTVSYHEHNERERTEELIVKLAAGKNIALVSDAGTPLISDPGFRIVQAAIERRIQVVVIPGPSALVAALSASGLPAAEFHFAGFLPSKSAARKSRLRELSDINATLVFYEAPHRIKATIEDACEVLGDRQCVIARELTKLHEEFIRGSLLELNVPESAARGEIVLLIGPPLNNADEQPKREPMHSILEQVEQIMREEKLDQKAALKRVARERRVTRSEAYRLLVSEKSRSK